MNILKSTTILIAASLIAACSSKNPAIVSELENLQIPVVQPSASDMNNDNSKIRNLYQSNDRILRDLTLMLKDRYLKDTKTKDIFDTHSSSHQVYASLTKLEEAGMVNLQYFNEKNFAGLNELNEKLVPYKDKVK